jgi:hypothetical protein
MRHIDVSSWIKSPDQNIAIHWAVNGAKGTTVCKAWSGQYTIESLQRAGYTIISVGVA